MGADSRGTHEVLRMNVTIRMTQALWIAMHTDLNRDHPFAAERVGFLLAEVATLPAGGLLLLPTTWSSVRDEDYIDDSSAEATIGPAAFRQMLQSIYRVPMSLLHVHRHEHLDRPEFSRKDAESMQRFIPGFFNACRTRPHGAVVLSHDCATAALWTHAAATPRVVSRFEVVGRPLVAWRA
jgi:hypothetical protein